MSPIQQDPGSEIEDFVRARLGQREAHFVFPSQAAADSWARSVPRRFGLKAVETGRFVSWDRFKELLLSRQKSERPAERLSRTLWAAGIVARQAKQPFLSRILGPGKPSSAFVSWLSRLPPALPLLALAARSAPADDGLADLAILHGEYARFLADKGLYEPAWEKLPVPEVDERWYIIASPLIEDFDTYAELLAAAAPAVELVPLPGARPARLYRFPNAFEELRWVFLKVAALLDSGTRPEDIAVTIPGLDQSAPQVGRAAWLAGVPVAIREGEFLSASPYARVLAAIAKAVSSGFAFEETKALLLDRFAAWKPGAAKAARDLVGFGIEYHAYAPYVEKGKRIDIWEESFALCGGPANLPLRDFYRRLKRDLRRIAEAPHFSALREAILAFRSSWLDESLWPEEERRRVERIMAELADLAMTEKELGAQGSLPEPLDLFLRVLGELRYVPRGEGRSVSVYPYRVSALLAVEQHFVLGCSQNATRVSYAPIPFLREDQKDELGRKDREATADFATAYAHDGRSIFSYAEEGFDGWSAPAPFFLAPGAPPVAESEDYEALREGDPLRAEAAAFRGEAALPRRLLGMQKRAAAHAAVSLGPKGVDYGAAGTLAGPGARELVLSRRRLPDGRLRLPATQLEEYLSCPFAWLLSRGLRLEEEPGGVGFFDARLAGEMAHAAIRRLFAAIGDTGPFETARLPAYRGLVGPAIASVLPVFAREKGPFLVPMFSAYAPLLEDRLNRLVEAETWMEGWEAGEFEAKLQKDYPELGLVLEGRTDRLASSGGSWAIIDFKKKALPRKAELIVAPADPAGEPDAGSLAKLQIAAYVALCEATRGKVVRAAYWSIEEAKRLVVLGPGGLRAESGYEGELAALDQAIAYIAAGLAAGDFSLASGDSLACESCNWAAVCRCRYATE